MHADCFVICDKILGTTMMMCVHAEVEGLVQGTASARPQLLHAMVSVAALGLEKALGHLTMHQMGSVAEALVAAAEEADLAAETASVAAHPVAALVETNRMVLVMTRRVPVSQSVACIRVHCQLFSAFSFLT